MAARMPFVLEDQPIPKPRLIYSRSAGMWAAIVLIVRANEWPTPHSGVGLTPREAYGDWMRRNHLTIPGWSP